MSRRSPIVALVGAALTVCAPAAQAAICPTGASGEWVVKGFTTSPITTWDDDSIKRVMGSTVTVTDKQVVFAGETCPVSKIRTSTEKEDPLIREWEGPPKWPGFDTMVFYDCANGRFIPVFEVGPSCNVILASRDGATFRLVRTKAGRGHGPR